MPLPWPFRKDDPSLLAQRHAREAVATLVEEVRKKGQQRVRAALALLDRGFGRPRLELDKSKDRERPFAGMSDEELGAAMHILRRHISGEKILPDTWEEAFPPRRRGRRGRRRKGGGAPAPAGVPESGSQAAPEAGAEPPRQ